MKRCASRPGRHSEQAMMSIIKPRLGLLSLICLLSACQTFKDGDRQLYEQSDRLFKESLEQTQAKVAPPRRSRLH